MRPMRRNVWGWLGIGAMAAIFAAGCELGTRPYPGFQGGECNEDNDPKCDDGDPCTDDVCDEHGKCVHESKDGDLLGGAPLCQKRRCAAGVLSIIVDEGAACGVDGAATCNAEGDCVGCDPNIPGSCVFPTYYCDFGVCRPLVPVGSLCDQDAACETGVCRDGHCCDVACSGPCQSCSPALTDGPPGVCAPVLVGTDPHDECAGGSCGASGLCVLDNGGACAFGSQCASGNCVDGVCCNLSCDDLCDTCAYPGSLGTCLPLPNGSDPKNECPGAQVCSGSGTCTPGPNGTPCGSVLECETTNCADGVCCDTSCNGLCKSCDVPGSVGTCVSIPAGQDPDNECAGTCNGAGACQ